MPDGPSPERVEKAARAIAERMAPGQPMTGERHCLAVEYARAALAAVEREAGEEKVRWEGFPHTKFASEYPPSPAEGREAGEDEITLRAAELVCEKEGFEIVLDALAMLREKVPPAEGRDVPDLTPIRKVLAAYRSTEAHITEEDITAAWVAYDRLAATEGGR